MPRTQSLQCLFCQQLNPADVGYCNKCDEQLNLRPCYRCGGVDLRTASNCHKCGGNFSEALTQAGVFQFRPSNFDQQTINGAAENPRIAESTAKSLVGENSSHHDLHRDDQMASPQKGSVAATVRPKPRVAMAAALLLLLTAASAFLFAGNPAKIDPARGQPPSAGIVSNSSGLEATSALVGSSTGAPSNLEVADSPRLSGGHQDNGRPSSTSANDTALGLPAPQKINAPSGPARIPAYTETCPSAVAALGLCSP